MFKMNLKYAGNPVRNVPVPPIIISPPVQRAPVLAPSQSTRNMGMLVRVAPPAPGTSCGCGGSH